MTAELKPEMTQQDVPTRALQRVPGLADLEDEALTLLRNSMRRRRYAAGETILRCGICDGFLAIVEGGEVSVTVELRNGLSFNGLVQTGSYFTLNGMLAGDSELSHLLTERASSNSASGLDNARVTARAVTPTTLLAIFRSEEGTLSQGASLGSSVTVKTVSSAGGARAETAGRETSLTTSRFIRILLALIAFVVAWKLWTSPWSRTFRADINYARGVRALQRGRENVAAWRFWSALNLNPSHAASYNALGYIYYRRGRLEQARSAFERGLGIDDDQGMLHNNLGVVYRLVGQEDITLDCLQRAAELSADVPEVYVNLGNFYLSAGDAQNAARAYREALRLDPELAVTHYNLGAAYYRQRQLTEAQASFKRAVALDADLSPAYLGLGVLAFEQGDFAGAQAAFQRATALNPQDPIAHFYLGLIYKNVQRSEESVLAFERVLGLTEDAVVREQAEWHLKALWGLP
jgi:tetratricopeptide (TPR) repeat protein